MNIFSKYCKRVLFLTSNKDNSVISLRFLYCINIYSIYYLDVGINGHNLKI